MGFDRKVHQTSDFQYFTDLSIWDTFRTVHPLYTLIAPKDQRDMVVSLVKMLEQGGWLPRWPSGHGYRIPHARHARRYPDCGVVSERHSRFRR
jgi:putative alpha-1,2-mannosidase